jgi:hypothetical protein
LDPAYNFLSARVVSEPGSTVETSRVYAADKEAMLLQREKPVSKVAFNANLKMKFPNVKERKLGPRGERECYWEGIRLKGE